MIVMSEHGVTAPPEGAGVTRQSRVDKPQSFYIAKWSRRSILQAV